MQKFSKKKHTKMIWLSVKQPDVFLEIMLLEKRGKYFSGFRCFRNQNMSLFEMVMEI